MPKWKRDRSDAWLAVANLGLTLKNASQKSPDAEITGLILKWARESGYSRKYLHACSILFLAVGQTLATISSDMSNDIEDK